MSHKKMLQCSMGALLLLLPWFGGLVLGEISNDFSECLEFFYNNTPPTGLPAERDQYQPICQRYLNKYRFATLYHRESRSPLYSAYILSPSEEKPKFERPEWMYEPQLANRTASREMQDPILVPVDQNVIESQAVKEDYKNSGFTKGHLNPNGHHTLPNERAATFTLTNIVPQREDSNNGWSHLENQVSATVEYCNGTMYVITGVMPYASGTHLMNGRVSVPEYMWSAYCCPNFKDKRNEHKKPTFPTYAAVGRNDPNSTDEIVPKKNPNVNGYDVRRMSLEELESFLTQRLNMTIILFNGWCK